MIISISNQKGGQGKSTTAQALINAAAYSGYSTLAIDLDPQANLTFSMGGDASRKGTADLLQGNADVIQLTQQGALISASTALATADTTLQGNSRIYALRDAIKRFKGKYDYIVLDCPPALNTLLINALAAADKVIIPMTADMYSLQGLTQLVTTIREVQGKYNKGLDVGGVLFVKHSTRTILARDLTEVIQGKCDALSIPIYDTTISEGVAVREAQTQRQSIIDYAPKSKPAKEYMQLFNEIERK